MSDGDSVRIQEYTAYTYNNIYKKMRIREKNIYFIRIRWVNVEYTECIGIPYG